MRIRQNIARSFKWATAIAILISLLIVIPVGANPAYIDPGPLWSLRDTVFVSGAFLFLFILGIFAFPAEGKE